MIARVIKFSDVRYLLNFVPIIICILDSQNFSGESDLVAEETGRKELEASIIETKLDDGETLGDFLVMTDGVLNTDKNVSDSF